MNKDVELAINNAYECANVYTTTDEKRAHVLGCLNALFLVNAIKLDDYMAYVKNVKEDFPY